MVERLSDKELVRVRIPFSQSIRRTIHIGKICKNCQKSIEQQMGKE